MHNIHLHPSPAEPKRFRLQIKDLLVQEYFGFSRYGSKEAAFKAAKSRRDELFKLQGLRNELAFNIFKDNGFIKGINLVVVGRRHSICMVVTASSDSSRAKRIQQIVVNDNNIDAVFHDSLKILLSIKKVTFGLDEKKQTKKARMLYIRKWHELNESLQPAIAKKQAENRDKLRQKKYPFTDDNWIKGLHLVEQRSRNRISLRLRIKSPDAGKKYTERKVTIDNFHEMFSLLTHIKFDQDNTKPGDADQIRLDTARRKYRRMLGIIIRRGPIR